MITFYKADCDYIPSDQHAIRSWLLRIAGEHHKSITRITYLFCSDSYMLDLNRSFLSHDYYTDILTFPYPKKNGIEADILISIDRVRENAHLAQIPFNAELRRVIVHGLLHLLGYNDRTDAEKKYMRQQEDLYLSIYDG